MALLKNDHNLDFAVIGAQKCATSWLYYCLSEHPELSLPEKKQEIGYIGGALYQASGGADWFYNRYADKSSAHLRGDVSVDYLYDSTSVEALSLHQACGGTKYIVSLRHPVDRLISSYFWLVRRGKLENVPIESGLARVLNQPIGFPDQLEGPLEEIVRRGCYADQLNPFIEKFGRDSVYVLLYEDVVVDPLETIQRIYSFLGVESDYIPNSLGVKPKKNAYNPLVLKLERLINNQIGAKFADIANQALAKFSNAAPPLSRGARMRLLELYMPEVVKLIEVLQKLPNVQRPSEDRLLNLWKLNSRDLSGSCR